jgi:hypothetical protein
MEEVQELQTSMNNSKGKNAENILIYPLIFA